MSGDDIRPLRSEGRGTISSWHLQLLAEFRSNDDATVTDVVPQLYYTARGGVAAGAVAWALDEKVGQADPAAQGPTPDLRRELPAEWAAFLDGNGAFSPRICVELFPYTAQGGDIVLTSPEIRRWRPGGKQEHGNASEPAALQAATDALGSGALTFGAAADNGEHTEVRLRGAAAEVALVVGYTV